MRDATLPSLSRRFTLLRAASGDTVTLENLKSKLAEQRARGAENYLSEEETDMFLQTLGRMRSKPSASSTSGDSTHGPARGSLRSTDTTTSSVTSTSGSSKRYSNNMFGSGKFRDHTYLRSVAKERSGKGSAGNRSAANFSTSSRTYKTSDAPIPEESPHTDSEPSVHDSDTTALASGVETSTSELEQGIIKTFRQGHLRRASMALDEVIRQFEEKADDDGDGDGDGDDQILIPRSPAPERASSLKRVSVSGCVDGDLFRLWSQRTCRSTSPVQSHQPKPVYSKQGQLSLQILQHKRTPRCSAPPHLLTLAQKPRPPLDCQATFQVCQDP
jgi:serine/arginine repetitive matrix protein 2